MQNQSSPRGARGPRPESPRFALLGPGRVGSTLGRWLVASGARLCRVSGRRRQSPTAQAALRLVDAGASGCAGEDPWVAPGELLTADLDFLLVAVSDHALGETAELLARRPQAPVALHVAGQFGAEVLAPLRRAGSAVGSLHPLRAFSSDDPAPDGTGTWFAVDGDTEARDLAVHLAERLGGSWGRVDGSVRPLYHLAATLAAGGVATLIAVVEELAQVAGLPPSALAAYLGLTRSALAPIEASGGPVAPKITGPAARGDLETLARQRRVLEDSAPRLLPLIGLLQEETLRRCGRGDPMEGSVSEKIPPPAEAKRE